MTSEENRSTRINWRQILPLAATFLFAIALGWAVSQALEVIKPSVVVGAVFGLGFVLLISRNPYWGVILIGFFLPFERIGSIELGFATLRISQILAVISIFSWMAHSISRGSWKLVRNPVFWPILIFLGLAWLSLINAPNTERSIVVLSFTAFTILVSLFLPNILTSEHRLKTMITAILIGMGVTCLFGIYQFAGDLAGLPTSLTGLRELYTKDVLGFPRIQSTALEPLYFANYLLLPLSLLLTLFLKKQSPFSRNVSVILLLLAGINFVLTVSRGGYIAGTASVLVVAVFTLRQLLTVRNLVTVMVVVALVGFISVRFLNQGEALEKFVDHAQNIFGGASYSERVETYAVAYRAILEHPVLGIGMGSFGPYASYHPYIVPSQGYQIVNNEYLELAAENGILGLLAFLIILFTLAARTVKAYVVTKSAFLKSVIIGLSAALIGILIQYNTFSILYIMHVWVTIGLLMCVQQLILNRYHEPV